ncbi:hypothetical protein [Sorangium sp. So ce145]
MLRTKQSPGGPISEAVQEADWAGDGGWGTPGQGGGGGGVRGARRARQ